MPNEKERIATAQWILERNLAWIAAAEIKIAAIVAINTAMLGALGAAFSAADANTRTEWAYLTTVVATFLIGFALFCAGMCVLPRTKGPEQSVVFFVPIAKMDGQDFVDRFKNVADGDLLDDLADQVHRNAEIAVVKFTWVKRAMWGSFLAVLPWVGAIALLVRK